MNNIKVNKQSIAFNGLIINGAVPQKSVKRLGDFASHIENINFINDIEKSFDVDVVLNNEITQMTFAHKKYGDLSGKYGCSSYQLENVFRDITEVIKNIKSAINKAAKDWEKSMSEKETIKRGC